MEKPSLEIGNSNWAIKEGELLGYNRVGNDYLPIPITMTRASAGTRVNPESLVEDVELLGSEEVTNGDFATNLDSWSTSSWWVWNALGAYHPSASLHKPLYQQCCVIGKTYLITFDLNVVQGGAKISLGTSSGGTTQVFATNLGTGSYSYFITASAEYLIFNRNNTGSNNEYYVNNVSVKEATIDNLARVDYTDGTSSLLVEPQRTNNLTASQDLTVLFWNSINTETIVASTVLSPDGTTFGFKAIPSTSTSSHYVDYDWGFLSMPIGEVTYSIFVKPFGYTNFQLASSSGMISRYQNFELTGDGVLGAGDVNGAKIEKIGDWYRCTITETSVSAAPRVLNIATPSSGLGRNPSFTGNGTDGVLLWGAQMEEGTYPTSYIPNLSTTSGSTVTRVQETYEKTGISDLINSEEGVLFVEMAALSDDGTNRYISINNGGTLDYLFFRYRSDNQFQIRYRSNNVDSVNRTFSLSNNLDFNKIAFSYKLNEFKIFINGSQIGSTITSGNVFNTAVNSLDLEKFDGGDNFFGKVKQLQVYKTALTDDELTILTGTSGVHFYTSYAAMASGLTYKIE